MKRLCGGLIIMLFVFAAEAFSKPWNGITPGISTRTEVEKILGKDSPPISRLAYFSLKEFTIYVDYYKEDGNYSDKDIVVKISVSPDNRNQLLKNYIKKIPNFHKDFVKEEIPDKISHVHGETHYRNFAEGFEIKVIRSEKTEKEYIVGFNYFAGRAARIQTRLHGADQK